MVVTTLVRIHSHVNIWVDSHMNIIMTTIMVMVTITTVAIVVVISVAIDDPIAHEEYANYGGDPNDKDHQGVVIVVIQGIPPVSY